MMSSNSPQEFEELEAREAAAESSGLQPGDDTRGEGLIKLFVGQVPKVMEEEELRPIFEEFGDVAAVSIIRDKVNGSHRDKEQAEAAIASLHNLRILPPSTNPLQVRLAEAQEHKLFIGMIPKNLNAEDITAVFAPFGKIEEVYILRDPVTGHSKGCAFLKFESRDSALAAIDALNGNVTLEGGRHPIVVKFADNRKQRQQKHRARASSRNFYPYGSGPAYSYPGIEHLQPQYMAPPGFPRQGPDSPAGVQGMNSPYLYYNMYPGYGYGFASPNGASQEYDYGTSQTGSDMVKPGGAVGRPPPVNAAPSPTNAGELPMYSKQQSSRVLEGPPGANLFIYHLPHDLTDADLATAFAPFGTVISAKVFVDKNTGESKGFGFVSYDSPPAAEAAITSMNGFQIGSKRLKVQHKRVHHSGSGNDLMQAAPQGSATGEITFMEPSRGMENMLHQSVANLSLNE